MKENRIMKTSKEKDQINVEKAVALAVNAHRGQVDKQGAAYIGHPLRVMSNFVDPLRQMAGVLHDVVEDTDVTIEELKRRFPKDVTDVVALLTRGEEEKYFDYIQRVRDSWNQSAIDVKLADLKDNMDPRRIMDGKESMFTRYAKSLRILMTPETVRSVCIRRANECFSGDDVNRAFNEGERLGIAKEQLREKKKNNE